LAITSYHASITPNSIFTITFATHVVISFNILLHFVV
jgi:hypothetical protein